MKKYIAALFVLVSALSVATAAGATGVKIDGVNVGFNDSTGYPFVQDGRTLVPLRATMEGFGAEVSWDAATATATVIKGTTTVRCRAWEMCVYRNNVKIDNDAAAVISNGRTYLPIRVVLESFGATVGWDGKNVIVNSSPNGSLVYEVENTPSVTTNYWKIWTNALSLKESGKYQQAIDKIKSISAVFLKKNEASSKAMLFKHLGECYSNLGDYSSAAICFKREAQYWEQAPGMGECVIDANRRAILIAAESQIFVRSSDDSMDAANWFGEPHEPVRGAYLGAYAESDRSVHNPYDPSQMYIDRFSQLAGREVAGYLLYLPYGTPLSNYASHIARAAERNKIIQIALEPHRGIHVIGGYDQYIVNLARDMQNSGCAMMLRFAGEMNELSAPWYTTDANAYIQAFRSVANIFHDQAPNVPVIWAPNYYPTNNIEAYYPGDEYVDYVGMSSYKVYQGVTDPMGQGIDRSRWSNQLDFLYSRYGHKKPIIIVEGGASYIDFDTGADRTDFATKQMEDFYAYLPVKYPNVKFCFHFDNDDGRYRYLLSGNNTYLASYQRSIANPFFMTGREQTDVGYTYYELGNNVNVKAEPTELCAYVTSAIRECAYVIYYINGVQLGISYGAPYSVNVDFTSFKGQKVDVTVKSYDANYMEITSYNVKVNVI